MKELIIAGCVIVLTACGGTDKSAGDSTARDTTIVPGAPANVVVDPAFVPETTVKSSSGTPVSASTPPAPARNPAPASRPDATPAKPPATPAVPNPPVTTGATTVDSVRGIVAVVGTSFEKRVVVAVPGSGKRIDITGKLASFVGHLAGADVSVTGNRSGSALEATSFLVRTVDNMPAIDGVLRTENSLLYIVTPNGTRTRISSPPSSLLGHDGARVWITGDPSKGVASFGFIDPAR